jgi:hypothetical protein
MRGAGGIVRSEQSTVAISPAKPPFFLFFNLAHSNQSVHALIASSLKPTVERENCVYRLVDFVAFDTFLVVKQFILML